MTERERGTTIAVDTAYGHGYFDGHGDGERRAGRTVVTEYQAVIRARLAIVRSTLCRARDRVAPKAGERIGLTDALTYEDICEAINQLDLVQP